eukprot:g1073.t1
MTSNNGVRGCLSELFDRVVEPQPVAVSAFMHDGRSMEQTRMQSTAAQNVPFDVCSELNLIFSSEGNNEQSCLLFGLSPPVRAQNPLCKDSRFQKQQKTAQDVDIYAAFLHV